MVASLRDSGLSIRAIAAATGMGKQTVQNALNAGVLDEDTSDPKPVTGTDGKTYTPKQRVEIAPGMTQDDLDALPRCTTAAVSWLYVDSVSDSDGRS